MPCLNKAETPEGYITHGTQNVWMGFAAEMVIKAALKGQRIAEVPVTLVPRIYGDGVTAGDT